VSLKYFLEEFSMENDDWFDVENYDFISQLPELSVPKLLHFGNVLFTLVKDQIDDPQRVQ
jgi:hypothetical protein